MNDAIKFLLELSILSFTFYIRHVDGMIHEPPEADSIVPGLVEEVRARNRLDRLRRACREMAGGAGEEPILDTW